jgi:hypothetical protein
VLIEPKEKPEELVVFVGTTAAGVLATVGLISSTGFGVDKAGAKLGVVLAGLFESPRLSEKFPNGALAVPPKMDGVLDAGLALAALESTALLTFAKLNELFGAPAGLAPKENAFLTGSATFAVGVPNEIPVP